MSKENPYSKENTKNSKGWVNPKIFVKVTPETTLTEDNDVLIKRYNPNTNIISPDTSTSIKNNNLKPNTNVNIVTPPNQIKMMFFQLSNILII